MAEYVESERANAPQMARSRCRGGRCRDLAVSVLAVAAGLLAWWLFSGAGTGLPGQVMAERPPGPSARMPVAAPRLPGLEVMARRLAERLEKEPMNGKGWALLARTHLALGDLARADAAHARALALRPDDAAMKAEFAAARTELLAASP
jgi:cytochrome c-type biogenesis protein CcmH/NrfG